MMKWLCCVYRRFKNYLRSIKMDKEKRIFILLGAGFSKPAGLPLAKEIEGYFTRNNRDNILKFGSGETKWYDFANETYRHNGKLGFDHLGYGYILNALVEAFIKKNGGFSNYEDFYQFLIDGYKQKGFIEQILKDAERVCLTEKPELKTNPNAENYLYTFKHTDSSHLTSLINHLIADLLYWRKAQDEIHNNYSSFIAYINRFESIDFTSLNHDLLLEYLLENQLKQKYSDGFSTDQKILFSSEGKPLNTFSGLFNESICLLKMHGSIDLYKYLFFKEQGSRVTYTGEYLYYKTIDYYEKQKPERCDPTTGKKVQTFHFEIMPQFITGTRKDSIIKNDKMYSCLYSEFDKRIHSHETVLIIGYSYADPHVNEKIKSAIKCKTVKRIININPGMEFPFEKNETEIINLKNLDDLGKL